MSKRLKASYLLLLLCSGLSLYAYTISLTDRLLYLIFPMVLIVQISLVIRTYLQEVNVLLEDHRGLLSYGWVPDQEIEYSEDSRIVSFYRGSEYLFVEKVGDGDQLRPITYYDGKGELYRNEQIVKEVSEEIRTHTHTTSVTHMDGHTQTGSEAGTKSESQSPQGEDTHTHTHTVDDGIIIYKNIHTDTDTHTHIDEKEKTEASEPKKKPEEAS